MGRRGLREVVGHGFGSLKTVVRSALALRLCRPSPAVHIGTGGPMNHRVERPAVELPTSLGQSSLRSTVDTALRLMAFDLWSILDADLRESYGPNWTHDLADKPDWPIHREDASTVVAALLTRDPDARELFRDALGRERWRRMFDQRCFSDISSVRNEFAHPDGQTTNVPWVEKALSRLAKAARVGALECFDDIQRLTASIQELKSGTSAPPGKAEVALVEEEFEAARAEAEAARLRAEVAEGLLELAADGKGQAEVQLTSAREQISVLTSDREHSSAALAEMNEALELARRAQRAAAQDLEQKEKELRDLDQARLETQARLEAAEQQLLTKEAVLAEQLPATVPPDTGAESSDSRAIQELLDQLRNREWVTEHQEVSPPDGTAFGTQRLPTPGEPWPYPRGQDVWRLSRVRKSMIRTDDDADLKAIVGEDQAARLVECFLAIRPAGGRVWVDVDGDSVTYVDGRLVYLGRLGAIELAEPELQPGDPVADFAGRGYGMTGQGRIECRSTGQTLKEAIGAEPARAVAERIRRVKPKGGRLKVSRDGTVAAYVDRQWVFVTRVRPNEWFPGHLK